MPAEAILKNLKKSGAIARLFCCLGAITLTGAPVIASSQSAAVESLGVRRCADLIAAQAEDETLYAAFGVWIGGYLTAANAYEPDTFDLTPWQPVELATAQIASACTRQKTATVAAATASFVQYLKAGRLTEGSALVQLRGGDKAMFMYRSVLADVRARLEARGEVIREPDGQFGESFGKAIQHYQRDNGLTQTGLPDTRTLILLMR